MSDYQKAQVLRDLRATLLVGNAVIVSPKEMDATIEALGRAVEVLGGLQGFIHALGYRLER